VLVAPRTHNTAQAPAASTAAAAQPAFATAVAPTPAPAPAPASSTEADNSHLKLFSSWGAGPRMHAAAPAPAPAPGLAGPTSVLGADDDARAGVGDSTDDRAAIMQLCGARLEAVVDLGPDALLFLPEVCVPPTTPWHDCALPHGPAPPCGCAACGCAPACRSLTCCWGGKT